MLHMGDITRISGASVHPVNVVIGGSPCQGLSLAGRRLGLTDERSGLFMEQIRIIKEMRCADAVIRGRTGSAVRPRFMVWENVPGAFSSNQGRDFQAVLEETCRIVYEEVPAVPIPKHGWPTAGCLQITHMGRKCSVAWRVFDAQFWGVPQRRRRIALVADFGGPCAGEILFERKGVSGYSESSATAWKRLAAYAENGTARDDCISGGAGERPLTLKVRCGTHGSGGRGALIQYDKSATLSTVHDQVLFQPVICIQGNCIDRTDTAGCDGKGWTEGASYTLNTVDCPAVAYGVPLLDDQGGDKVSGTDNAHVAPTLHAEMHGNIPEIAQAAGFCWKNGADAHGIGFEAERSPTLRASVTPAVMALFENHSQDSRYTGPLDTAPTVSSTYGTGGNNQPFVVEGRGVCAMTMGDTAVSADRAWPLLSRDYKDPQVVSYQEVTGALMANSHPGSYTGQDADNDLLVTIKRGWHYIVRRLTPLECERLQGYPDGFTDIGPWQDMAGKWHKRCTDSTRYKALGNSIAIPPWFYVLQRLSIACGVDNTMASLFDGIGGFPLIWEGLNGADTCLWASEIEEFPIAVTKERFKYEKS